MQVTRSLNVGGLERLVGMLAKSLDRERFEVSIVCLLRKGNFSHEIESAGIEVHLVAETETDVHSRWLFRKVAHLLRSHKPDILHTHNTHAMIDGTLASILAGVPIRVHTDHARPFPDKLRYMMAERLLSRFVDKIVAVSDQSKQDLVRFEGIPARKIVVVPNGTNIKPWSGDCVALRSQLGIGSEQFVVGTVSRLTEQKGVQFLIEALAAVVRRYPGVMLVIVGDGTLRQPLEQQVVRLSLGKHVKFIGYTRDVAKYLAVMDLCVFPSQWEGMPIGVLEAMACSRPIVAAAVGGIPEVIEHGRTGYLVPPADTGALSAAIQYCVSCGKELKEMGRSARARYEERFSLEAMVANYEKLYAKVVNEKERVIFETARVTGGEERKVGLRKRW